MNICEYEFEREDPHHKGYSLTEIDFYFWIPQDKGRNHRLTLWKNLKTNKFELIKVFTEKKVVDMITGTMITNVETEDPYEIVITHENLEVIIEESNGLCEKYHGLKERDSVCTHHYESFCYKRNL